MTISLEDPVLIVGGGIAGLALARDLTERRIPFRLFERNQGTAGYGLAVNLPGNAVRALGRLGLSKHVEQVGVPLKRREYRSASDSLLFSVNEDRFWGEGMRPRGIRRHALMAMLAEGLPDEAIFRGVEVSSLTVREGRPVVRLRDGNSISGSVLVGADGVRSQVRKEVFGTSASTRHAVLAEASWRFMAPNPGIDCWTVWGGAAGMILLMPVGDNEVYGWAAVTRGGPGGSSRQAFEALATEFPARVRGAVIAAAQAGSLHHSPLEEVRLERWHRDRVILIGDAAHATAPIWAQGAALGLEDALLLGSMLASATFLPGTLAEFEARRRPRVDHVQRMTDEMSSAGRLPPFVRNLLLPIVGPRKYDRTYRPLRDAS